jgi:hypothetical protein
VTVLGVLLLPLPPVDGVIPLELSMPLLEFIGMLGLAGALGVFVELSMLLVSLLGDGFAAVLLGFA